MSACSGASGGKCAASSGQRQSPGPPAGTGGPQDASCSGSGDMPIVCPSKKFVVKYFYLKFLPERPPPRPPQPVPGGTGSSSSPRPARAAVLPPPPQCGGRPQA